MKRVYLTKIVQHGNECYIGKIDPRNLVKIATKVQMSEVQDAQRPLNEKRVKDIANYVSDDSGILPNTLTIATRDDRIRIMECEELSGVYYALFPDKENEYKDYNDSIDVMDGQHRLYSFLDETDSGKPIRMIDDSIQYEIGFTMFIKPTLKTRRKIFISCNEKQEKVSPNLLLWFRSQLSMLSEEEECLYDIVSQLSQEYPLKGHVIMSAEKVKNGLKAQQIIADFKYIHILDFSAGNGKLSTERIVKMMKTYLSAWQNVCDFDFSTSSPKEAGVAVKMAGLKYMIYVLPAVWDHSIRCQQRFSEEFVEKTLKQMISSFGLEYSKFFLDETINKSFRDRTMIQSLANESKDKIKKIGSEEFDPLA